MDKLLMLDSGHSFNTAGKKSPDNSFFEWGFNNRMQYKIKKRAEEHGIHVFLSNPNPDRVSDIPLSTRATKMNDYWKAKGRPTAMMISLHANAYSDKNNDKDGFNSARGTETFVASNASKTSKDFAKSLNDEVVKTMRSLDSGAKDRGVKVYDWTVIYKTNTPCVLAEYGFYTNRGDLKILKNNQDELVEATIKALCKYFGVTYKPVKNEEIKEEEKKGMYENVIIYKGEVDGNIAEIVHWGLTDSIVVSVEDYKAGLGKKTIGVGGVCNELATDVKIISTNRFETIKVALNYIGK